jgi:hypothetical protein
MAVRKLHMVETDQDGCTQVARDRNGPRWLYASCVGWRRTKMAVRKLLGVEKNARRTKIALCNRTTGPRSDLRLDSCSWANSGLDLTCDNVETESLWVTTRGA